MMDLVCELEKKRQSKNLGGEVKWLKMRYTGQDLNF